MTKEKGTLLLHTCCAVCACGAVGRLIADYAVTLFFYNPNIYPEQEYARRIYEARRLATILKLDFIEDEYNTALFYDAISGLEGEPEGGKRCAKCFQVRLDRTAQAARDNSFGCFATTLTTSPHKDAHLVNSIGEELAKKYEIKYLASDFKKNNGFKESIDTARKLDMYRQEYCGCEFSIKRTPKY